MFFFVCLRVFVHLRVYAVFFGLLRTFANFAFCFAFLVYVGKHGARSNLDKTQFLDAPFRTSEFPAPSGIIIVP